MFDAPQLYRNVEARTDDLVRTVSELIRFETVSGMEDAEGDARYLRETRRCLDYLRDFAARNGFAWREHPEGAAALEWGQGDEAIGFAAHTDVVPAVDRWIHPPFGGVVDNGVVYGRGAQDNKGPLASGLIALLAIRDLGAATRRTIRLIFGVREEGGNWTDIDAYIRSEPAPVNCIIPDATFPIINGEKGMATLQLAMASLVAPERKDGLRVDSLRSGERFNIVPDRAELQLSGPLESKFEIAKELKEELVAYEKSRLIMLAEPMTFRDDPGARRFTAPVTFLGKAAHGSRPEEGHNAAVDALGFVVRLHLPPGPGADFLGFCYLTGKDTSGEYLGVDYYHPFIGLTTASLNVFQYDGPSAQAQINVRFPLGMTSTDLMKRARRRIEQAMTDPAHRPAVEFLGTVHDPLFTDPEQFPEFFEALRAAYETVTGRPAKRKSTGGTTYAKGFPRAVSFGPVDEEAGEPDLAHKADESVSIDVLVRNTKIYAHALAMLALK
jgi:succinyl-diaminopimelate desuccinylase